MKDYSPSLGGQPLLERLESRQMLNGDAPLLSSLEVQSGPPPVVVDVHVSGSAWSHDFIDYLTEVGLGRSSLGRRVVTNYAAIVPWVNLNRITVRFTHNMAMEADDVLIRGVAAPAYPVEIVQSTFDADTHTTTATLVLAGAGFVKPDNLLIEIDGDPGGVEAGPGGLLLDGDRNGIPGGDFVFRMSVVPGASTLGANVGHTDLQTVRQVLGTIATDSRTTGPFYHASADLNADGRVNVIDLAHVRQRLYTYAPLTAPQVAATAEVGSEARTRPATRSRFSSVSVLA